MDSSLNQYNLSENFKKGYQFEQWVVSHLPERHFLLMDWRSDKQVGTIRPQSSMNPDLVYRMFSSKRKVFFAIECKWRANNNGPYPWARMYKRIIYNKFGLKLRIPIHIAIGIGGTPDQPESVYLVPFQKIRYSDFLNQNLLNQFFWPADIVGLKKYILTY